MTTEFQSFFETLVLDFLKSCVGLSTSSLPGTRRTLGQLAHQLSSEDVVSMTTTTPTLIEAPPHRRRSKRRTRSAVDDSDDTDSVISEQSSIEVSTSLTPASESSNLTVQSSIVGGRAIREGSGEGVRGDPSNQSHGMTLRDRNPVKPGKRVFEDSDSEGGEDRERGAPIRTRSWGTPHKRQRLSSDSDGEDVTKDNGSVATVTRTSRGRLVKPTQKFS